MFFFFNQLRRRLREHQPFYWFFWLLGIFISLFVLHLVFFMMAESVSAEEALWQTWQTFTTVGYGNRPAETWMGRLNSMVFSTLGIAVMGSLFAAAFDMKLYFNNLKRYGQMKNPFRNGYVVVHFPGTDDFAIFVREIRSEEPDVGICILDPNLEEIPNALAHVKNLHLVRGSCTDRTSFEKAGMRENRVVIVFAPQIDISGADAMTKTVVNLLGSHLKDSQTRLIHLLEDSANGWMFEDENSVQITEDLDILAAVQECSDPFSSQMVESMLRNTDGPSIKTVKPVKVAGWNWGDFCQRLLVLSQKEGLSVTPIGLVRKGKAMPCPQLDETIQAGDYCALICVNHLDWNRWEANLVSS